MKIAYFGTAEFSRDIFLGIKGFDDVNILVTVSQPDTPVGRKQEVLPTPLKVTSNQYEILCLQPNKIRKNTDFFEYLRGLDLDFIVVVAYGKILPKEILEIPKYGTINIHGSLLPKYRGASPIQESLKNGDSETGLTIMLMSEGMDEGDILTQTKIKVDNIDNSQTIFAKFTSFGPKLLVDTLRAYMNGEITPQKQDETKGSYCQKISKEDGLLNFQEMTAKQVFHLFQAYFIWPGVYTILPDGKRLVIENCFFSEEKRTEEIGTFVQLSKKEFGIVCKEGIILLRQVKPEGKKSMDIVSFVNGNGKLVNTIFSL